MTRRRIVAGSALQRVDRALRLSTLAAMSARRWLQIHLSTAIVLMFVAAFILFVNLRIHRSYTTVERTPERTTLNYYDGWGWPFLYDSRGSFAFINDADGSESKLLKQVLEIHEQCPRIFSITYAIINGLVALALLILATLLNEAFHLSPRGSYANTPRHWPQLHLSTCLILMFAAGGLLWANMPRETVLHFKYYDEILECAQKSWGWPFVAGTVIDYQPVRDKGTFPVCDVQTISEISIALNIVACLAMLFGLARICENFIYHGGKRGRV